LNFAALAPSMPTINPLLDMQGTMGNAATSEPGSLVEFITNPARNTVFKIIKETGQAVAGGWSNSQSSNVRTVEMSAWQSKYLESFLGIQGINEQMLPTPREYCASEPIGKCLVYNRKADLTIKKGK